jgi:hypothetical protein
LTTQLAALAKQRAAALSALTACRTAIAQLIVRQQLLTATGSATEGATGSDGASSAYTQGAGSNDPGQPRDPAAGSVAANLALQLQQLIHRSQVAQAQLAALTAQQQATQQLLTQQVPTRTAIGQQATIQPVALRQPVAGRTSTVSLRTSVPAAGSAAVPATAGQPSGASAAAVGNSPTPQQVSGSHPSSSGPTHPARRMASSSKRAHSVLAGGSRGVSAIAVLAVPEQLAEASLSFGVLPVVLFGLVLVFGFGLVFGGTRRRGAAGAR